jgi:hypothetical protein
MMLIFVSAKRTAAFLAKDRDAALALLIDRVHHALGDLLVRREHTGLAQHGVDQRRLAVIDVRDYRDVAQFLPYGHP